MRPGEGAIYYVLAALERGDFSAAWESAGKLPRGRLSLDHALALVALMSLETSAVDQYEAAVDRWLERARLELPDLPLGRLARLLDWLPDLPAVGELQEQCEAHAWPVALATLDHLLPRV